MDEKAGVEIARDALVRPLDLVFGDVVADDRGDALGELVLGGGGVRGGAQELVGPGREVPPGVDQPGRDADLVPDGVGARLEEVVGAEHAADPRRVLSRRVFGVHGQRRDHDELRHPRELRRQGVLQVAREIRSAGGRVRRPEDGDRAGQGRRRRGLDEQPIGPEADEPQEGRPGRHRNGLMPPDPAREDHVRRLGPEPVEVRQDLAGALVPGVRAPSPGTSSRRAPARARSPG